MTESISLDQLTQEIAKLTKAVQKSNSWVRGFFMGMVRGLGAALGATLLAAILITLLWRVARTINLEQYLGPLNTLPKLRSATPTAPVELPQDLLDLLQRGNL